MIEQLKSYGYTDREAAFLAAAALASGYFLRSQFNSFIGKECGALGQQLIERAIRLGHITVLPPFGNRLIYHVSGSSLFSALGDPDNRNRREHRAETIRRRLMALDYIVAGAEGRWLLSQRAKLDWFSQAGLLEGDLPAATFPGKARCFFADKQPILASQDGSVGFAFIDGNLQGFSQWELFLKAHRIVLQKLADARVVFAGHDPHRFRTAEAIFRKLVVGQTSSGNVDRERLLCYFEARKLFDSKTFGSFDQARLDEFRENKRVFAGERFDELYWGWLVNGPGAVAGVNPTQTGFSTHVLQHSYEWLSPIRFQERRASKCPSSHRSRREFEKP